MVDRATQTAQHATVRGSPGEAPRLMGLLRAVWPFFILFAAAGYLVRAAWPHPALSTMHIGLLMLVLAAVFAGLVMKSERRLKQYMKGAKGEEGVARVLGFLPAGYRVFHGVRIPAGSAFGTAGEIDHVVVGPAGLFAIETKNWSGRVTIRDGVLLLNDRPPDRPPLEQAGGSAQALEVLLAQRLDAPIHVQPVLCFASGSLAQGTTGMGGVVICNADSLARSITGTVDTPLTPDVQEQAARCLGEMVE